MFDILSLFVIFLYVRKRTHRAVCMWLVCDQMKQIQIAVIGSNQITASQK